MNILITFGLFLLFFISVSGWGGFTLWTLSRIKIGLMPMWIAYLAPVLGSGITALIIFFIGLGGGLYPITAWILLLVGITLTGILVLHFYKVFQPRIKMLVVSRNRKICLGWIAFGFAVVIVLIAPFYSLIVNALMPPIEWDELAYHLALPAIYVRDHFITQTPYIFQSFWPLNTEMLFTQGLLLNQKGSAILSPGGCQFGRLSGWHYL